jgi:membrane fusion protein (multidrug efflux system)
MISHTGNTGIFPSKQHFGKQRKKMESVNQGFDNSELMNEAAQAAEFNISTNEKLTGQQKNRSPRKIITLFVVFGILIYVSFRVYRWYNFASTHEETDNATVTGQIFPISARISGTVSKVLVKDNQVVQKGQLLLTMDPRDFLVNIDKAKAALDVARRQTRVSKATVSFAEKNSQALETQATGTIQGSTSALSMAQSTVDESQSAYSAALAQLAQVNTNLEKARADYNRYISLKKENAISEQQFETAKTAYESARAQKKQVEELIEQSKIKISQAKENITGAKARLYISRGGLEQTTAGKIQTEINKAQYDVAVASVGQAEAALKDALNQFSYTKIYAPENGRIGKKAVEAQQKVQPGQPLLAVVGADYWIVANFKETQVGKMRPGQNVDIYLDAFPSNIFKGKIESFAPASGSTFTLLPPDNATGNFTKIVQRIPVKIVFDPKSVAQYTGKIIQGMSAYISVNISEKQ